MVFIYEGACASCNTKLAHNFTTYFHTICQTILSTFLFRKYKKKNLCVKQVITLSSTIRKECILQHFFQRNNNNIQEGTKKTSAPMAFFLATVNLVSMPRNSQKFIEALFLSHSFMVFIIYYICTLQKGNFQLTQITVGIEQYQKGCNLWKPQCYICIKD